MAKQVKISSSPDLLGIPRVDFLDPDFNVLIWNKGYDVLLERAIPCPCSKKTQHPQSACRNCLGTGWIYVNAIQTKAVIQSINKDTKYKDWSQELIGTVNITIENRFQLSFRDRLSVIDSETIGVEVLIVREVEGRMFAYTMYPIKDIEYLYRYNSNNTPLDKIAGFNYEENILYFTDLNVKEGDSISIRYKHNIIYSIIDINHDIRNSYVLDHSSRESQNRLPVSAVGRKLHYVFDNPDIFGNVPLDNEFDKD